MREIPLRRAIGSVLSVQSLEHVPDPERAVAEARAGDRAGWCRVFVTPNRLTFGRPDEIIDPWHLIEFDPEELRALCEGRFGDVDHRPGCSGRTRYPEFQRGELAKLDRSAAQGPAAPEAAGAACSEDAPV